MPVEKPFVKPSTPIIKRLFDFSDRNETKKMLEEMLLVESTRLRSMWNFAAKSDIDVGETFDETPMCNKRFSMWERQDRKDVPHYYTRPFHRHRSESKMNELNSPSRNVTSEIMPHSSPLPLSSRNENLMKQCTRVRSTVKSTPMFASPPRISSETVNPSLARFVTALRVPLPIISNTDSVIDENKPNQVIDHSGNVRHGPVYDPPKNQAFRQLFEEKKNRKRNYPSTSTQQPKITDFAPLRKSRFNTAKRPRNDTSEHFVSLAVDQE